jgi:pyridoxal phosphate enzyme (YggS family)
MEVRQFNIRGRLVTSASWLHARIAPMPEKIGAEGVGDVAANLARVRERIARAAERAGRRVDEVSLVAVSKTFSVDAVRAAHEAGVRHFGENRVQEMDAKRSKLANLDAIWHFIGHLQSNKARLATQLFDRLDSLDSLSLAQKLDSAARDQGKRLPVLIEVHLGGEVTKSGIADAGLPALAEGVAALLNLELRGLMAVPPHSEDAEMVRPYFRQLRALRDTLSHRLSRQFPVLSMGMSHDFEVAIEEGATEIRVGTAIFGARSKVDP